MTAAESRPADNRTAKGSAENGTSVRLTAVITVRLPDDWTDQRRNLADVAELAPTGANVRLRVGHSTPAPWIRDFIRDDLRVQVESSDSRAVSEWMAELA